MVKKIPISFNNEDIGFVKELIDLLGISDTYGDFPKAVKFGIRLAVSTIKHPEKVYQELDGDELYKYFMTRLKHEQRLKLLEKAQKLEKEAQKV